MGCGMSLSCCKCSAMVQGLVLLACQQFQDCALGRKIAHPSIPNSAVRLSFRLLPTGSGLVMQVGNSRCTSPNLATCMTCLNRPATGHALRRVSPPTEAKLAYHQALFLNLRHLPLAPLSRHHDGNAGPSQPPSQATARPARVCVAGGGSSPGPSAPKPGSSGGSHRRAQRHERKWRKMLGQSGSDFTAYLAKHPEKVKCRARKGIPDSLRGLAWQLMSGESPPVMQSNGYRLRG